MFKDFLKKMQAPLQLESPVVRRVISTVIAVIIAMVVDQYYSMSHIWIVPLITLFIMWITVRVSFRQVLQRTLMACFILCLISLIFTMPFNHMHDVVLGGLVAVLANLLIFPRRPDIEFRQAVISVLNAYSEYLRAITDLLFRKPLADLQALEKKISVEKLLQARQAFFPDWVYDTGFNPLLQEGHRHFLVKVEQLGQVLFALHQIARHPIEPFLLDEFSDTVQHFVGEVQATLRLFVVRLALQKTPDALDDFGDDITILEETYRKVIRVPLEALDMSSDYIDIAALIYDLKDMHKILLKLAEALR
jgi:hypothetical protein